MTQPGISPAEWQRRRDEHARAVSLIGEQLARKRRVYGAAVSNRGRQGDPVVCVETERRFKDAKAAAAWAGVTPGAITSAIRDGGCSGTGHAYHWRWEGKAAAEPRRPRKSKAVRCVERPSVQFGSIRQAANACGVSDRVMSLTLDRDGVLRAGRSEYVGMRFKRVDERRRKAEAA